MGGYTFDRKLLYARSQPEVHCFWWESNFVVEFQQRKFRIVSACIIMKRMRFWHYCEDSSSILSNHYFTLTSITACQKLRVLPAQRLWSLNCFQSLWAEKGTGSVCRRLLQSAERQILPFTEQIAEC